MPWDGEVAEDDEGEGEDEEELPGGTEELVAGFDSTLHALRHRGIGVVPS